MTNNKSGMDVLEHRGINLRFYGICLQCPISFCTPFVRVFLGQLCIFDANETNSNNNDKDVDRRNYMLQFAEILRFYSCSLIEFLRTRFYVKYIITVCSIARIVLISIYGHAVARKCA